jgi:hypothetical protein
VTKLLNNFLVEKSTADAILILLPAYTGPAPFTIFATVALVLTPVLSGLAIFLPLLRQNQQRCMQLLKIQNLMEV